MTHFLADPIYNPDLVGYIDSTTKLGPGVSVASFLGSYGNRTSFDYISDQTVRHEIARNLYLHAEIIRQFNSLIEFANYRLVISESISPQADGTYLGSTDTSVNSAVARGQAVVYELTDQTGKQAHDKIFDLAIFWKDYIAFSRLYLDYDTYNPDGSLNSCIVLFVPTIYNTTVPSEIGGDPVSAWENRDAERQVSTFFNGSLSFDGELVEILPSN